MTSVCQNSLVSGLLTCVLWIEKDLENVALLYDSKVQQVYEYK